MALVAFWGALCLHTAPTETYFPSKGRNFGNTSSSPPAPLLVISYLYLCKLILCCIFCFACVIVVKLIIQVVHLVAYLDNIFDANPNLLKELKIVSCLFTPSSQLYRSFQLVSEPCLFIKDFAIRRVWLAPQTRCRSTPVRVLPCLARWGILDLS